MEINQDVLATLVSVCKELEKAGIDYRVTGVLASNIYGRGLSTNVLDIAVESDAAVYSAVDVLNLPRETEYKSYDPYVCRLDGVDGFIRIQGDILGEAYIHTEIPFKLHSKELLLERLDIYGVADARVAEQAAFIALTLDDAKIEKYKSIWNRM